MIVFIYGNIAYYTSEEEGNAEAPTSMGVMLNLIILSYVRLLRIITIVLFLALCCPVIVWYQFFGPARRAPASRKLLKKLNKLRFSKI